MVAPAQNYFIRSRTGERGPFTLSQVSAMWFSGNITADSFYRLSNVEDWAPISQLEETLGAVAGAATPKQNPATVPPVDPPKRVVHSRIVEGDGSRESPFVIHTSNHLLSAQIQGEIIDLLLGAGTYRTAGRRAYFPSPRGKPGNGDLCEHVFQIDGREVSVWFDLYLVTQLAEDPELKRLKKTMVESPQGRAIQSQIRKSMGHAEQKQEKQFSGIGCFVVTVILIFLFLFLLGRA